MDSNVKLMELKIRLKKWEIDFVKKTGEKPNKNDIANDAAAKMMYTEYARLKRKCQTKPMENSEQSKSNSSGVWGDSLLKINSTQIEVDKNLEEEKAPQPEECQTPTTTYRDRIRLNVGLTHVRSLPTNLKRVKSRVKDVELGPELKPRCIEWDKPQEVDEDDKNEAFKGVRSFKVLSNATNNQQKQRNKINSLCTPVRSNKSGFLNKNINISWLNDQADDLSDLVNLETEINSEKEKENIVTNDITKAVPMQSDALIADFERDGNHNFNANSDNMDEDKVLVEKPEFGCDVNTLDTSTVCNENRTPTFNVSVDKTRANFSEKKNAEYEPPGTTLKNAESSKLSKKPDSTASGGTVSRSVVSTNFVRVNMQQKKFSRKGGKGRFLRKQVFREKLAKKGYSFRSGWKGRSGGSSKSGFRDKSEDKCFKCGEPGHWASKCKNKAKFQPKTDPNLDEEPETTESIREILENCHQLNVNDGPMQLAPVQTHIALKHADPVYEVGSYDEKEVLSLLKKFGFSQFRPGQEKAIKRILCGKPTLLVLSTGSGKSLCYQLPAYMYSMKRGGITLVISPLVSLMDDQVHGLPKFLRATRLHSGMTKEQRDKAMVEIEAGNVDILLVSPEALTSWSGMSPRASPLSKLPPISFVCVDECHCLSEWSHSFRPSYLRVCQVLKEQLGIDCLVGLTATATITTCLSVAKQLGISDPASGLIMDMSLPDNLLLTVSRDIYKDEALEQLLNGARFKTLDSVIIYCTRREEVARLSAFLRTRLQFVTTESETVPPVEEFVEETASKKRKRSTKSKSCKRRAVTWEADCYHAGMSAAERRRVQNRFMSGKLRIVVATVAFGMGIDKQDVRAVIHYNMPRSFERYVQEVGRAGRDRLPAHCHLFLNADGGDLHELSRHTYGKSVDRYTIKQLVKSLFPLCQCSKSDKVCSGHLSALSVDSSIEDLDLSKEGIETLLCYLEADMLLKVFLPTETNCYIHCYGGSQQMIRTAKKCPAVALALSTQGKDDQCGNEVEFSLIKVANSLGMDIVSLKRNLRNLMWDTTLTANGCGVGKSGVTVEFRDVSFLIKTKRHSSNEFLDEATDSLYQRVRAQERKELAQLRSCFHTMQKFSYPNVGCCMDDTDGIRSNNLKAVINTYFKEEEKVPERDEQAELDATTESDLRATIHQFLCVHSGDLGSKLTGRAIARILHGIDSPRYPARTWGPARRFWRSKIKVDFNAIVKIATSELVKFR